jgi:hypothetical protein
VIWSFPSTDSDTGAMGDGARRYALTRARTECPMLGEQRKTSAPCEDFAFWPDPDIGLMIV